MPKARIMLATGLLLLAGTNTHADTLRLLPTGRLASAATLMAAADPAAPALNGAQALVAFQQSADRLLLTGEDDSRTLSFVLSEEQMRNGGTIRLAYQNAVSILPDDAILEAELNGHPIGSFAIRSPSDISTETLAVSPDMLRPGRNVLRVRARQHHRVDCSADAVYELWTRLDQARSGFAPASGRPITFTSFSDLQGIGRDEAGRTVIRIIAPPDGARAIAADAIRTLATLALYLDRQDVTVEIGDTPGRGPGIDFYFGDADAYRQTPEARRMLSSAPLGLSVRAGTASERASIIMRGAGRLAIDGALLSAVNGPLRSGIADALASRDASVLHADNRSEFTLADTGYRTAPFHGRLSHTEFDLMLPADFYPGDYGNIDLYLKAATAPGLEAGAQFLVRVNDRAVTSYRFRDPEGERLEGKRIELPLRAFHAGLNRVELLAELPTASDRQCGAVARGGDKPRFIMLQDTRIEIPPLAHIGRTPDLAALAGRGYPFAEGKPFDLVVSGSDSASLAAALTMVVRLSVSAGRPLDAALISSSADAQPDRAALVLDTASAATLPAPLPALATTGSTTDLMSTAAISDIGRVAGGSDALLDAFQAKTALTEEELSWKTRLLRLLAKPLPMMSGWFNFDTGASAAAFDRSKAIVTLEQQRSPLGDATWTTISAANPTELAEGVTHLTAAENWSRLEGGTAFVRKVDRGLVLYAPTQYALTEFTDTSFSNLRRLTAAWLSDHFGLYVALVVGSLGLFGFWLGYIVPRSGVRTIDE